MRDAATADTRRRAAEARQARVQAERAALGSRTAIDPQEGFWLMRVHKQGALVPARIWYERLPEHAGLPVDPWPNSEARILGIFAEIAGKACPVDEVWLRRGTPITEAEYRFRSDETAWAREYMPTDPIARPHEPSRLRDVPLPF